MLDDHPGNCAGARLAGLHTILVDDPAVAVDELRALLAGSDDGRDVPVRHPGPATVAPD